MFRHLKRYAWALALLLILAVLSWLVFGPGKDASDFQHELDALRKEFGFPGATAAYVRKDGTFDLVATGFADLEAGAPMTPESRMLAGSIGKTFVGALAVALAHEGTLDLDAPVSRWLGSRQWYSRLPNHHGMTLRHLLTHSAGLPDHVYSERFRQEMSRRGNPQKDPLHPEALVAYILDTAPLFEAGRGWAYTDTGYILIGLVIEEATKRSYYAEIAERFLRPLALTRTSPADRLLLPGLAAGYTAADNPFGFPAKTISDGGSMVWHPGVEWTGGGLVSNSLDLARWGRALFSGKVLPGASLDELLRSIPAGSDDPHVRYGAGVAIRSGGEFGPVYGHAGWIPGYTSSLRYYPDHGVSIAFQINTDVGIMGRTQQVMSEMETRLANLVITARQ